MHKQDSNILTTLLQLGEQFVVPNVVGAPAPALRRLPKEKGHQGGLSADAQEISAG